MTYLNRENYTHAPLALVTVEVRLNYDPRANVSSVRDGFALAVRSEFPILNVENVVNFSVDLPTGNSEQQSIQQIRGTNASRTATVSLNPNSLQLSVIGHSYQGYDSFKPFLETCLNAMQETLPEAGIERVGIRFLDEVRVPVQLESVKDWSQWVNPGLLASVAAFDKGPVLQVRGSTVFSGDKDCQIHFQWGDFNGETIVSNEVPLEKPTHKPGKFFVLDVDSAWQASEFTILTAAQISERVESLHVPIGSIFQWAISEQSRELFRGNLDV